jgi:hypothetical protein
MFLTKEIVSLSVKQGWNTNVYFTLHGLLTIDLKKEKIIGVDKVGKKVCVEMLKLTIFPTSKGF